MRTLCVDIGGTGIKGLIIDEHGEVIPEIERKRELTPRPATPQSVLDIIEQIALSFGGRSSYDRVSVGFPGVVEEGVVRTAPNLDEGWSDFPLVKELQHRLSADVRAANDAGVQGLGVIEGHGTEVVVTLGTGMGFGLYIHGRYVPNIEFGHHPFRKRRTYEERVCDAERERIGNRRWKRRVHQVISQLKRTFNYQTLYLGGGNARHLTKDEFSSNEYGRVVLIDNVAGLLGGIRLWEETEPLDQGRQGREQQPPPESESASSEQTNTEMVSSEPNSLEQTRSEQIPSEQVSPPETS